MTVSKKDALERAQREMRALTEVSKTLAAPLELPELLFAVMNRLGDVFEPARIGAILLWDEESELLRPAAVFGLDIGLLHNIGIRPGESILGQVYDENVPQLVGSPKDVAELLANLNAHNRKAITIALNEKLLPHSMMIAPISIEEQKFGILVLGAVETKWIFIELDVPFIQSLTELIALAIERSRFEDISFAVREAARTDQLRSEVMATLSHELRTPLAAIKGYSTALLIDEISWPEEKRLEFLQMIDDECENLQTMINDILDSSLIDVGELAIEPQPVRIERLVQDIADDMQRRTDVHKLYTDFPAGFPIIDVDPRRITQVLRNILDNAIKYSPEGGLVVIRGEVRPVDVVISIADQGVGISAEDLIPLFEKYFRVKAATGYHVAGTGLGLPVARSIVEAHNGRIWAESRVGEGTTLYFSLPRSGLSSSLSDEEDGEYNVSVN